MMMYMEMIMMDNMIMKVKIKMIWMILMKCYNYIKMMIMIMMKFNVIKQLNNNNKKFILMSIYFIMQLNKIDLQKNNIINIY